MQINNVITHCKAQNSLRMTAQQTFQSQAQQNVAQAKHHCQGHQLQSPDMHSQTVGTAASSVSHNKIEDSLILTIYHVIFITRAP